MPTIDEEAVTMAKTIDQRMTAEMDGEFVVFLIGLRISKPWKIHKWLPWQRSDIVTRSWTKMRPDPVCFK